MDRRIDPETDESLCAHTAHCSVCYQNLMVYSLMHTNYLNDSDSMKIKLQNLAVYDQRMQNKQTRVWRSSLVGLVTSVAAVVLFAAFFLFNRSLNTGEGIGPLRAAADPPIAIEFNRQVVDIRSWVLINHSLNQNDLYSYSTRLPGLQPIRAISNALLNWLEKTLYKLDSSGWKDGMGWSLEMERGSLFSRHSPLALGLV